MSALFSDHTQAELTKLRLFKWTDDTAKTVVNIREGLFIFNVTRKQRPDEIDTIRSDQFMITNRYVTKFNLEYIFNREFYSMTRDVLQAMDLFNTCSLTRMNIARQISDYIKSCFDFRFNFSKLKSPLESSITVLVANITTYEDYDNDSDDDGDNSNDNGPRVLHIVDDYDDKIDEIDDIQFLLTSWVNENCVGNLIEVNSTLEIILQDVGDEFDINSNSNSNNNTCLICLEKLISEKKLIKVKGCKHVFHSSCLIDWIKVNNSCPCCRSCTLIKVSM